MISYADIALHTQEKFAAGLALLDMRTGITDEDWRLCGVCYGTVGCLLRPMPSRAPEAEACGRSM